MFITNNYGIYYSVLKFSRNSQIYHSQGKGGITINLRKKKEKINNIFHYKCLIGEIEY